MKSLIEKIKEDSDSALKEIYLSNKDKCISWMNKNTNLQREDRIEMYQVAIVILYDNVISGKLNSLTSHISTYLIAICKNKAMEYQRKYSKTKLTDTFPLLVDHMQEDLSDKILKEEQLKNISKALLKMGDPCSSLLKLFYYQKLSMNEICNLMGYRNVATTKNQKYKCIKRLRSLIINI